MSEFKMPALGADMEAGTLLEWLIKPGQRVKRGDIVAVVDTEKAAVDVEIWMDGVVERLLIEPGIRVPVGTVLALIRTGTEAAAAMPAPPQAAPGRATPKAAPAPVVPAAPMAPVAARPAQGAEPQAAPGQHRVSPLARRMARDLGVDLARVAGTGPAGTVTHTDVERAAADIRAAAAPAGSGATPQAGAERLRASPLARRRAKELGVDLARVPGTGAGAAITQADVERAATAPKAPRAPMTAQQRSVAMRRAIAQAMARSKREIPHYYLGLEIKLDRALAWLERENAARSIVERVLYSVLLVKAVALSAREVPDMNGFWVNDGFQASAAVHVGMAISLRGGGLVAPALHDADRKSPVELMRELKDLVARTRAGSLRSSELSDPSITITNLGEQGVDTVFGIIFPPQVALVGFGRVSERRSIQASLSADHRASDGHRGALFLAAIDRRLQAPETL